MIYFMEGNERYLKKQEIVQAVGRLEVKDFCYQEFWQWNDDILEFIGIAPFIGDKKICVLYFFPENESLLHATIWEGTDIYIISETYPDRRKSVVNALLKKCTVKKYEKIHEDTLYKCIFSRLKGHGFSAEEIQAAEKELMQAFYPYFADPAMTLETVITHVDMIGYSGSLESESIRTYALDSSSLKGYRLATMILDQKEESIDYASRLLDQGESPIGLLSLVLFQIRICYKASLCRKGNYLSQIGIRSYQLYEKFLRYGIDVYVDLYGELQGAVNRLKSGEKNSKAVVSDTILYCLQIEKRREE